MMFRPYPVLSVIAVPALLALVALGIWQVQRAQWKAGLIADFERLSADKPTSLDVALCGEDPIGKVVKIIEARGLQLRVFGHNAAGDAGWRLFQSVKPGCSGPSGGFLAETGFEPLKIGGEIGGVSQTAPATPAGLAEKFIVETFPARQFMANTNSPQSNEWYWFDAPAMATFLGDGAIDQRYVLTRLEDMPDYLSRTPPSGHIGYAVTWFGMAIAFVVIYALFHARAGRLRFRRQDPPDS